MLLPYYQTGKTLTSQASGPRGFGSSDLAFWVQEITASRPLKDHLIQGNKMLGLLDTGADISCIAGKGWLSSWPTRLTSAGLVGIGSVPSVAKSSQILTWSDEKGDKALFAYMWFLHYLFLYGGEIYYLRWECFISNQMKRLLIKCCK